MEETAPLAAQGFNEGKGRPFGAGDMRFTTKGDTLYAIVLGWPDDGKVQIKSLARAKGLKPEAINKITILGGGELPFAQNDDALQVTLPQNRPQLQYAVVLKIN